jgi:Cu(I)/Ag(I) efflux system membrane protein CusA/SilA
VIHVARNRYVDGIVSAELEGDAKGISVSAYQGGQIEFFVYLIALLTRRGGESIRDLGGGLIALAGVAAETGVVMLIYLDHAWKAAQQKSALAGRRGEFDKHCSSPAPVGDCAKSPRASERGRRPNAGDLYGAVMEGAVERVRPKLMTVVAIMAGLLPIMWSTGAGSEVMRRIAAPMVGGMVSSTVLTLMVIPAIYALVKGWRLGRPAAT